MFPLSVPNDLTTRWDIPCGSAIRHLFEFGEMHAPLIENEAPKL